MERGAWSTEAAAAAASSFFDFGLLAYFRFRLACSADEAACLPAAFFISSSPFWRII